MGTKRLDTISDYARHGFDLQVKYRVCAHIGVLDARALSIQCTSAGPGRDMGSVTRRLKCQGCRARDVRCRPIERSI